MWTMAREGPVLKRGAQDADERLLIEAAQKDPHRFADLYEQHVDRIYAFIARRVQDRDAAQDLTSDVFHRALANLRSFEWRGAPFAAWLFRIAANAVADHAQRVAKQRGTLPLDEPEAVSMEEVEERARLFRCVSQLPEDQRRVINLRFAQQNSIREIAQALGRTEGAVKQLQFRALQNLRARMSGKNG
jgi:RNA polymerase sigma-70 factor, ECF subfamily